MSAHARSWSDFQIDRIIGAILRSGVVLSALVVFAGGAVYLLHHGLEHPNYRVFHGEPNDLRSVSGILSDAVSCKGRGVIQLGLLFLIGTPVARVAFTILAFALQRDRTYVIVTLIVFAALLFSIAGGVR